MEFLNYIKFLFLKLNYILLLIGVFTILFGSFISIIHFFFGILDINKTSNKLNSYRFILGNYVSYGLDILLSVDIIESVINDDQSFYSYKTLILILFILVRAILGFVLNKELSDIAKLDFDRKK